MAPHAPRVCLRGDSDFYLTAHFDRWAQRVDFIFRMDNSTALRSRAEALHESCWRRQPLIGKHAVAYAGGVATVFRALDDETRRLILDELAAHDRQTLFEICTMLTVRHGVGSTRQAISQHLAVLEDAGLVTTERRGRTKLHYFNSEPLAAICRRWPINRKN